MTIETPPQGTTTDATPTPETPAPRTCPRCSAPLAADQDWCLSCGAAVTTRIERPPNWRLPIALVATIVVLALGAVGLAFLTLADDPEVTTTATAPGATAPAGTTGAAAPTTGTTPETGAGTTGAGAGTTAGDATATGTTEGTATGEDGATGDATTGEAGTGDTTGDAATGDSAGTGDAADASTGATGDDTSALSEWPNGESGWTVILYSAETRADAEARAAQLTDAGTTVGMLRSDDYPSLRPGYWVLFNGDFDTREEAEAAVAGVVSAAPDAYVRRVEPA